MKGLYLFWSYYMKTVMNDFFLLSFVDLDRPHRRAPGGGRGVKPTLFGKIRDPPLKKKRDPTLEKPRGPPPKKTSYFGPQAQIFLGGLENLLTGC